MRKPIIMGNWKMNGSVAFAKEFIDTIAKELAATDCDIVLCPPATTLYVANEQLKNTAMQLGAQNVYFAEKGAYTGELSCSMLQECGVQFVLLGHSERRKYFYESNADINQKAKAVLAANMQPVICFGESLEARETGKTEATLALELKECLNGIEHPEKCIIAYEPLWAIGTGKTPTAQEANATIEFIRAEVAKLFTKQAADSIRILYGGSVTAQNAKEFLGMPEIDGALIGGASLNAAEFMQIIKNR